MPISLLDFICYFAAFLQSRVLTKQGDYEIEIIELSSILRLPTEWKDATLLNKITKHCTLDNYSTRKFRIGENSHESFPHFDEFFVEAETTPELEEEKRKKLEDIYKKQSRLTKKEPKYEESSTCESINRREAKEKYILSNWPFLAEFKLSSLKDSDLNIKGPLGKEPEFKKSKEPN